MRKGIENGQAGIQLRTLKTAPAFFTLLDPPYNDGRDVEIFKRPHKPQDVFPRGPDVTYSKHKILNMIAVAEQFPVGGKKSFLDAVGNNLDPFGRNPEPPLNQMRFPAGVRQHDAGPRTDLRGDAVVGPGAGGKLPDGAVEGHDRTDDRPRMTGEKNWRDNHRDAQFPDLPRQVV